MPNHPRRQARRKMGRYIRGGIEENLELGALVTKSLTSAPNADVVTEKTWISSVVLNWAISDLTGSADTGPIVVGVAHSDYTDAEIEAFVEQVTSWDEGDLTSREIGSRKIRTIGQFHPEDTGSRLNDGKPISTKLGWMLTTANTIDFWAYNQGSANLADGAVVNIVGHANLWPR